MKLILFTLLFCTSVAEEFIPTKGSGKIFVEYLRHKTNQKYIFNLGENKYRLFLRARSDDVSNAYLHYEDNGKFKKVPMTEIGTTRGKQYFYVDIFAEEKLKYFFEVKDWSFVYFFGEESGTEKEKVKSFEADLVKQKASIPSWAKGAVWYQIFVDRFRNGDVDNDPLFNQLGPSNFKAPKGKLFNGKSKKDLVDSWNKDGFFFTPGVWTSSWSEMSKWEKKFAEKNDWYKEGYFRHYGGDLKGIIEKLDYLKDLGINVINLSPVCYSHSNHKFDVIEHRHISPDFGVIEQTGDTYGFEGESVKGSSEYNILKVENGVNKLGENLDPTSWKWTQSDLLFARLIKEAHARGIKVVLSFPIEYVGKEFWAFKEALSNKDSKYRGWFIWEEDNYKSFDKHSLLPLLNLANKEVVEYLKDVLNKFLLGPTRKVEDDLGIDGLVVDIKNPATAGLAFSIKDEAKKLGKEIVVVAESGENGSDFFGSPKNSDSVLNFRFFSDILRVVQAASRINLESLKASLELNRLRYADNVQSSIVLPISTFDLERAFSAVINFTESSDRAQENKRYKEIRPDIQTDNAIDYLEIAATLAFTYVGSPMLCYGDEVGMWGAADPQSRKPMIWDDLLPYDKEYDDMNKYSSSLKRSSKVDSDEANDKLHYKVKPNRAIERFFKGLLEMREDNKELFTEGTLSFTKFPIDVRDKVFGYSRFTSTKAVSVIINFSKSKEKFTIPLPYRGRYYDVSKEEPFDGSSSYLTDYEMEPLSVLVLFKE